MADERAAVGHPGDGSAPSRLTLFPVVAVVLLALASLVVLPRQPPVELLLVFAVGCTLPSMVFIIVLQGVRPLLAFVVASGALFGLAAWSFTTTDRVWVATLATALLGCLAAYGIHRLSRYRVGPAGGESA